MGELIEVRDLKKYYPLRKGVIFSKSYVQVRAVDGVSFAIPAGKTLGLVGESGCGKSTLGRTIMRVEEMDSGSIIYRDTDITHLKKKELGWFRKEVQMVFQDPRSSLDPRMTIGNSIEEALIVHGMGDEDEREERVKELLVRVGLDPDHMTRYPHELSGGQQQRVGIARALAVNPALIVADEPVSALDVSVQAQILNLLSDLKKELGLSYLFIAHNLWVIRYISDKVAIMYLGKIVELADKEDIFDRTLHPYTEALLSSLPGKRNRIILKGEVPSPVDPPRGCRFHPRCPKRFDRCDKSEPEWREIKRGHFVMCHLYP